MQQAVWNFGIALLFTDASLLNDPELIKIAATTFPNVPQFLDLTLINDSELLLELVDQNPNTYRFMDNSMKSEINLSKLFRKLDF